ncbi:MAG TPA: DUF4167 domain-containing protein [Dongiaceae bacterium]|jgi:hypothetical protein|nr:DUF4167 domain-containing protein [Dongiaceae bacterium]
MRQGSNPRRSRGRGPRKPHGGPHNPHNPRPQNFDGSGQDVRVRGNTYQVMEKYLALARDASLAGDRIAMENYLQHAEHYYRTINADGNRPRPPMRNDGQPGQDGQQNGQYGNGQGGNEQGGNVQGGNGQSSNGQAGNGQSVNGPGGNDQPGNSTNGYESQRAVPADEAGDDQEN